MSQTSYAIQADQAFAGLLADFDSSVRSSISLANEESAAVEYGRGVTFGTAPTEQFALPASTGFIFAGVVVHKQAHDDLDADGPVEGENAEILNRGRVWVIVEEAIAITDPVFLRHTANVFTPGSFRTDADTANADELTNCRWLTETSAAGIALLEVNAP